MSLSAAAAPGFHDEGARRVPDLGPGRVVRDMEEGRGHEAIALSTPCKRAREGDDDGILERNVRPRRYEPGVLAPVIRFISNNPVTRSFASFWDSKKPLTKELRRRNTAAQTFLPPGTVWVSIRGRRVRASQNRTPRLRRALRAEATTPRGEGDASARRRQTLRDLRASRWRSASVLPSSVPISDAALRARSYPGSDGWDEHLALLPLPIDAPASGGSGSRPTSTAPRSKSPSRGGEPTASRPMTGTLGGLGGPSKGPKSHSHLYTGGPTDTIKFGVPGTVRPLPGLSILPPLYPRKDPKATSSTISKPPRLPVHGDHFDKTIPAPIVHPSGIGFTGWRPRRTLPHDPWYPEEPRLPLSRSPIGEYALPLRCPKCNAEFDRYQTYAKHLAEHDSMTGAAGPEGTLDEETRLPRPLTDDELTAIAVANHNRDAAFQKFRAEEDRRNKAAKAAAAAPGRDTVTAPYGTLLAKTSTLPIKSVLKHSTTRPWKGPQPKKTVTYAPIPPDDEPIFMGVPAGRSAPTAKTSKAIPAPKATPRPPDLPDSEDETIFAGAKKGGKSTEAPKTAASTVIDVTGGDDDDDVVITDVKPIDPKTLPPVTPMVIKPEPTDDDGLLVDLGPSDPKGLPKVTPAVSEPDAPTTDEEGG